jgi:hypothetical protein
MQHCRDRSVPAYVHVVTLVLVALCLSPCTVPFATLDVTGTGASKLHDGLSLKDKISSDATLAVPAPRPLASSPPPESVLPADAGALAARQDRFHTILRL